MTKNRMDLDLFMQRRFLKVNLDQWHSLPVKSDLEPKTETACTLHPKK